MKNLWSTLTGSKGFNEGELRVQNTRPVRNSLREDFMEIDVTPEEQGTNVLGVMNGAQLSDGSIGTAPHAPIQTFLSSRNDGARAAHTTAADGDDASLDPRAFSAATVKM